MIDDAVLEDLFRSAGEALVVPPGGPDAVRAARDGGPNSPAGATISGPSSVDPTRSTRRLLVVAAAAAVLLAGWAGADTLHESGGSSHPAADLSLKAAAAPSSAGQAGREAAAAAEGNAAAGSKAQGAFGSGVVAPPSAQSASGSAPTSGGSSPNEVPAVQSEIIKTGSVSLTVARGTIAAVMTKLDDLAEADGGFVASSSTDASTTNGTTPSGDITLRVPVAQFDSLLASVQKLGTPTSVTTSGQDVTSQYVDLQARIQSLEDARTQFQQILAQAQSIGDILAVEQQISDLQTQLEQLQGQLRIMANQASYSTLSVHVSEMAKPAAVVPPPPRPPQPSGIAKAWAHARHSFSHGLEGVLGASGGFAVFLLFAGSLALVLRLGWIFLRRRLV